MQPFKMHTFQILLEAIAPFFLIIFAVFVPNWQVTAFEWITYDALLATFKNSHRTRLCFFR